MWKETLTAYVLFPMTLLMFIWTVSCFKLMANTTSVSHGAPCCPAAFPFLLKEGVDVFVTESGWEYEKISKVSGGSNSVHIAMVAWSKFLLYAGQCLTAYSRIATCESIESQTYAPLDAEKVTYFVTCFWAQAKTHVTYSSSDVHRKIWCHVAQCLQRLAWRGSFYVFI